MTREEMEKEYINAQIAKLMAETTKINAEARWYPVAMAVAVVGAAVALAKLFS